MRDRGQVFLPTNNALSPVGHVHWYLEQLGQGVQHVASRVASLPEYVQRANDYRAVTGEGVTFLNIPRTYYGLLEPGLLTNGGVDGELLGAAAWCASGSSGASSSGHVSGHVSGSGGLSEDGALEVIAALRESELVDKAGAVSLDADDAAFDAALLGAGAAAAAGAAAGGGAGAGAGGGAGAQSYRAAGAATRAMVLRVLRRSCYVNLWKLMGDQLPEQTYLSIVWNKIMPRPHSGSPPLHSGSPPPHRCATRS